jgi:mono/diheme cytochrome c family protein
MRTLIYISVIFIGVIGHKSTCAQSEIWTAPPEAQALKNPKKGLIKSTQNGEKLYHQICASCHGDKGSGDGPVAKSLKPAPASLNSETTQTQTDGSLFWKISEGRNGMGGYKMSLTSSQRWDLVNYIRTFNP